MKYVIAIIIILVGMFIVIKSELVLRIFGYNEWAETKFRIWGGSRSFYKLLGIAFILLGTFIMTGWAGDILMALFGPRG